MRISEDTLHFVWPTGERLLWMVLVAQASSLWGLVPARTKIHRLEACATKTDLIERVCYQ